MTPRHQQITSAVASTAAATSHKKLKRQQLFLASASAAALLLLCAHLSGGAGSVLAKPLNQNQVRFRRLPPKEFSAQLSSSITIECEAGGAPPPSIHWLKDGERIVQNDLDDNQAASLVDNVNRISLSATRARLFIDCADYSDEATYTCVAENAFSRIASHTKLNLIKPAQESGSAQSPRDASGVAGVAGSVENELDGGSKSLSAVSQCLSQLRRGERSNEQARIHMWTHNILEVMNNNVVLFCRSNLISQQPRETPQLEETPPASGSQEATLQLAQEENLKKPQVSWTLPTEKPVGPEHKGRYEILDTGDLLIKDLVWEDMGQYVCTVSDEQSSDSVTTFVYPAAVKPIKSKRATVSAPAPALTDFRWINQ